MKQRLFIPRLSAQIGTGFLVATEASIQSDLYQVLSAYKGKGRCEVFFEPILLREEKFMENVSGLYYADGGYMLALSRTTLPKYANIMAITASGPSENTCNLLIDDLLQASGTDELEPSEVLRENFAMAVETMRAVRRGPA